MNKRLTSKADIGVERSEPKLPADLRDAFAADGKAKAKWADLTSIARRDFLSWLDSAKQEGTRKRRIEKMCSMLVVGKRRPCCYTIVSFDLYTALKARPKAKVLWSDLTGIERRDFIAWMEAEKETAVRKRRIEAACEMLASGKRRP